MESVFKHVLRYPEEGWRPDLFNGSEMQNTFSMLDPGMVLGRMFCAQVEFELQTHLKQNLSPNGGPTNLPWLLRYLPDDEWNVSEVFGMIRQAARKDGVLRQMEPGMEVYFEKIYQEVDERAVNKFFRKLKNAAKEIDRRTLLHVSAPKFHQNWKAIIDECEDPEVTNQTVQEGAKQQWSMVIGLEMEEICRNLKNCTVLQSGGGHVLLLLDTDLKGKELEERAKTILKKISEDWKKKDRGWSPKLWATWEGSGVELPFRKKRSVTYDDIIRSLSLEHAGNKQNREEAVRRWAIFGHKYDKRLEGDANTLYLDVISLGEKCWGKNREVGDSGHFQNEKEVEYVCQGCKQKSTSDFYGDTCDFCGEIRSCVPTRSRRKTVEGFNKSRRLTAMIESTFGMIITEHNPREILSMGGDEMIAKIDQGAWGRIVEDVEKHCRKLYGGFLGELEPEPIWWAMNLHSGVEPDQITSEVKDSLREVNRDWGSRFVQPMFTNLTTISDS